MVAPSLALHSMHLHPVYFYFLGGTFLALVHSTDGYLVTRLSLSTILNILSPGHDADFSSVGPGLCCHAGEQPVDSYYRPKLG